MRTSESRPVVPTKQLRISLTSTSIPHEFRSFAVASDAVSPRTHQSDRAQVTPFRSVKKIELTPPLLPLPPKVSVQFFQAVLVLLISRFPFLDITMPWADCSFERRYLFILEPE